MTPSQIALLALKLRARHAPPVATMRPSDHGAASAIWALAEGLEAVAEEADLGGVADGQPMVDQTMLRREALDGALRSASGKSTAAECVAGAEVLLSFLRGDSTRAERKSTEGDGGAPDELHALLDFVWARTSLEASGYVSLAGQEAQDEAESYIAEYSATLLRIVRQVLTVTANVTKAVEVKQP